ncbi:MAG: pantoate--beta-alanine ligase [Planctomycetota bacterium]
MKIVESTHEAYAHVNHWRMEGQSVGLIPTMGALHEGHYSLVRQSVTDCDLTVATIFVNPTQFGPDEDLERYPRTLEADLAGLRELGTDLVFVPTKETLYPPGFSTYVDEPDAAAPLEGEFRPGHFRGVMTIVMKLFQILPATIAYFGQKDFQQVTVIRRMVEDLNVPIRVVGCPTVREQDGLAMSSRNRYLTQEQRKRALCLNRALSAVSRLLDDGERQVAKLENAMREVLDGETDSIDYARVVDSMHLQSLETVDRPAVALIAAQVGTTRLIDNLMLER